LRRGSGPGSKGRPCPGTQATRPARTARSPRGFEGVGERWPCASPCSYQKRAGGLTVPPHLEQMDRSPGSGCAGVKACGPAQRRSRASFRAPRRVPLSSWSRRSAPASGDVGSSRLCCAMPRAYSAGPTWAKPGAMIVSRVSVLLQPISPVIRRGSPC
jgi:hypothetical protein